MKNNWTRWTQRRLEILFQEYNAQYFNGRLKNWGVAIGSLDKHKAIGLCESAWKQLHIDTDRIQIAAESSASADDEVRSTLLHEMAHAAARRMGHGYEFWEQIEKLLRQGAPVTLDSPEAPSSINFTDIIPKKFPLSRKAMEELEIQRARKVEQYAEKNHLKTQVVTDEHIITSFVDAAFSMPFASEVDVVSAVAERYGLFDISGKPKNSWAANIIVHGKKAYRDIKKDDFEEVVGLD
jgi:SprT-like family